MKKNELDILIPVFNEDETIIETIKNILSAVNLDHRILVCYDYEEDPTLEIIKKVKRYLKDYDYSVWIDGNILIISDIRDLVKKSKYQVFSYISHSTFTPCSN